MGPGAVPFAGRSEWPAADGGAAPEFDATDLLLQRLAVNARVSSRALGGRSA